MACANCGSGGGCSTGGGCGKNGGCSTGGGGCNKFNTFDWLSQVDLPEQSNLDIVEVGFKQNARKEFYRRPHYLHIQTGDWVVVESATGGYDIGRVSLAGELVRLQMKKKKVREQAILPNVLRLANERDVERLEEARSEEKATLIAARAIARGLNLDMKIGDVEFQGDKRKVTFYYTADGRVDFRELIRIYAREFKVKIEMRQIGARQESARVGGIGACGRELCCTTWLAEFKSVSTVAARYQNLAINQVKLSGQCGRLKCCLNYEFKSYLDALRHIPREVNRIETQRGRAVLVKTDIFKKIMYFGYVQPFGVADIQALPVDQVRIFAKMNATGQKPADLADYEKPKVISEANSDEEENPANAPQNGQASDTKRAGQSRLHRKLNIQNPLDGDSDDPIELPELEKRDKRNRNRPERNNRDKNRPNQPQKTNPTAQTDKSNQPTAATDPLPNPENTNISAQNSKPEPKNNQRNPAQKGNGNKNQPNARRNPNQNPNKGENNNPKVENTNPNGEHLNPNPENTQPKAENTQPKPENTNPNQQNPQRNQPRHQHKNRQQPPKTENAEANGENLNPNSEKTENTGQNPPKNPHPKQNANRNRQRNPNQNPNKGENTNPKTENLNPNPNKGENINPKNENQQPRPPRPPRDSKSYKPRQHPPQDANNNQPPPPAE